MHQRNNYLLYIYVQYPKENGVYKLLTFYVYLLTVLFIMSRFVNTDLVTACLHYSGSQHD